MSNRKAPAPKVHVGSYWADNKIWMLGRVVQVIAVDDTHATIKVTKDQDSGSPGHPVPLRSQVGKQYRVKLDLFRSFDRPRHGGFLPASGPDDGRTEILLAEQVNPVRRRGMAPAQLLQRKYASGWIVRVTQTGETVDFEPRRKGDGRAWRASDGSRYPSTKCEAEFPPGMRMWFGVTLETNDTKWPTANWFQVAHVMVSDKYGTAACGIEVSRLVFPSDALGLDDDLNALSVMCEACEAESPSAVMAHRVTTRLTDWGIDTNTADGAFDTADLDRL